MGLSIALQADGSIVRRCRDTFNDLDQRTNGTDAKPGLRPVGRGGQSGRGDRLSLVEHMTLTPVNVQCAGCETLAGHRR